MCWEIPWVNFQQKKWCSKRDINNKVGKESSRNDKHRNVFFWLFNGYLCPDLFYPNPICHNIPGFLTSMTMLCCLNLTFSPGIIYVCITPVETSQFPCCHFLRLKDWSRSVMAFRLLKLPKEKDDEGSRWFWWSSHYLLMVEKSCTLKWDGAATNLSK